jgi:hypothetical protein
MPKFHSGGLDSAVLYKLHQVASYSKARIKTGLDAHEQARGIMFTHQEVVTLEEVLGYNYRERVRLRGEIAVLKSELEASLFKLQRAIDEIERLQKALDFIAEGVDVGRHDGLPEDGPAHDADTMFAVARAARMEKE